MFQNILFEIPFIQFTGNPLVQCFLTIFAKHLQADGQGNRLGVQPPDDLQLGLVVGSVGVVFAHDQKADAFQCLQSLLIDNGLPGLKVVEFQLACLAGFTAAACQQKRAPKRS